eukprot:1161289-Pelagomonas_calceolata.AAC.5
MQHLLSHATSRIHTQHLLSHATALTCNQHLLSHATALTCNQHLLPLCPPQPGGWLAGSAHVPAASGLQLAGAVQDHGLSLFTYSIAVIGCTRLSIL